MGKYAILLSGGINFQEKDIQVLFANAKELEYGGEKIITQEASLNNLRNSLQEMSRWLEEDDALSPNNPIGDRIRALYGPNYVEIPQMKCNIVGKLSL